MIKSDKKTEKVREYNMFTLQKDPNRDFRVLNLTDPQLDDGDWAENRKGRKLLEYTVNSLVERTRPDLITVSTRPPTRVSANFSTASISRGRSYSATTTSRAAPRRSKKRRNCSLPAKKVCLNRAKERSDAGITSYR